MLGLVGNVALVTAFAWVVCLIVGRWACVVLTPPMFVGFAVVQQVWPESVLATQFAVNREWTTNWWVVVVLFAAAVLLDWHKHSVPRGG